MKTEGFLEKLNTATSGDELNWLITQNLLETLPSDLVKAVWAVAIPHWFNAEILANLLPEYADSAEAFYLKLQSLPFVESFTGKGHNIHQVPRRLMLQSLWIDRHDEFLAISARASDYFAQQKDAADIVIEHIYHLWIVDQSKANQEFIEQTSKWDLITYNSSLKNALRKIVGEHIDSGRERTVDRERQQEDRNILELREGKYQEAKDTVTDKEVTTTPSTLPVSRTKTLIPRRRKELLSRKRLLDMLFSSLDKKLTLITAPAGYGKTSLLIDMAHASELPCCWFSLDELDRNPQRFVLYFISALSERFPGFGGQTINILNAITSFDRDLEKLLVSLVNEMYEQIHEHFILVLDDFHLVDAVEPITNFIGRFIQLVDENCHLIISTRILTTFEGLALMVAREQVSGLSFTDLSFRPDEIKALIEQNNGISITYESAEDIALETEGWITGIQFSGISKVGQEQHLSKDVGINTGISLFDYLGQQVLSQQSQEIQRFLLHTSLLEEFNADLCKEILGSFYPEIQNWDELISTLSNNSVFVLPIGVDGKWLRYHTLFRDFLQERVKRDYPNVVAPILNRLAHFYEKQGDFEKAYQVYKQFADLNTLADVIERTGFTLLENNRLLTLSSWLNDLPPSIVQVRPGLVSLQGSIEYLKGDIGRGLSLLIQAEATYRANRDNRGLALTLVQKAIASRYIGDYNSSMKDAEEVLKLTESNNDLLKIRADALRVKGLALFRRGEAHQSIEFLESSLSLYERLGDTSSIPILAMETGMVYRATGDSVKAKDSYEKALRIWRQEGNLSWQASLLNNLAVLHYFQGEYESAAFTFEEGLLFARRSGNTRMEALTLIGLGDLYSGLEDFSVARQSYELASSLIHGIEDHFLFHSLILAQANLALLQGNTVDALAMITTVVDSIKSSASLYEKGLLALLYGRFHLLEGNLDNAIAELNHAQLRFSEDGRDLESAITHPWLAAVYHQKNMHNEAVQEINILVGNHTDIAHAVLVAVYQARRWLDGLQRAPEVSRQARDLFVHADQYAAKLPAARRQLRRQARVVQVPAPHLTIQAFGSALVSTNGKPLTLSEWQTQSVRELFFYLLTVTKPLTKEQVAEALWLDLNEPARLKLRFKNEIYRLRRAVGQDVILYEDVFYSFNRSLDYEYDVEAFESYLARARSVENVEEQIALYQKAMDLVHGPFLIDFYSDWATIERERLSRAYLTSLLALADLLEKQSQLERALAVCQRAVEYDPTYEAAYRLIMEIHHRLGNRAAIMRAYQACQDAMQRILDLPPSKETEEFYRLLIA